MRLDAAHGDQGRARFVLGTRLGHLTRAWAALAQGRLACWPTRCGAGRPSSRLVGLVQGWSELGVQAFELGAHAGEEVRRDIRHLDLESTSSKVEKGRLSSVPSMVGRKELDRR